MVINHLLNGVILQVPYNSDWIRQISYLHKLSNYDLIQMQTWSEWPGEKEQFDSALTALADAVADGVLGLLWGNLVLRDLRVREDVFLKQISLPFLSISQAFLPDPFKFPSWGPNCRSRVHSPGWK